MGLDPVAVLSGGIFRSALRDLPQGLVDNVVEHQQNDQRKTENDESGNVYNVQYLVLGLQNIFHRHVDQHVAAGAVLPGNGRGHRQHRLRKHVVKISGQIPLAAEFRGIEVFNALLPTALLIRIGDDISIPVHQPDVNMQESGNRLHLLIDHLLGERGIGGLRIGGGDQRRLGIQVVGLLPQEVLIGKL